jgi:hypothetical protein
VIGAVAIDVTTPSIGGKPIMAASANPYGKAIKAAMAPPDKSPAKFRKLYFRPTNLNNTIPFSATYRNALTNYFVQRSVPAENERS